MDTKPPGIWSLVLVPALITLAVTVLRVVGQVNGWSETLFGKAVAGGSNAIVGISWLIFVFGLWFGFRVQRSGFGPKRRGRALVTSVVAIVIVFGGMALGLALDLMWFPDAEHPGEPRGLPVMVGVLGLAALVSFFAYRRVALAMLVYGALARLPVVAVTWLVLHQGWDTHYTKVAPGFPEPAEGEALMMLAMPQLMFWPLLTVVVGTAMGCLGAMLAARKHPTA